VELGRRQGYVETIFKRRRYLPDLNASNRMVRANAERMALNTPIQGSSADIIKVAMIRVFNTLQKMGLRARLLLQVHDELVGWVEDKYAVDYGQALSAAMVKGMNLYMPTGVKAEAKIADTWK
jgi:DNA polymerase-1